MKTIMLKSFLLSFILFISVQHHAPAQKQQSQAPFSSSITRLLNYIEQHIVDVAEAMPEEKFDFTPESLDIKSSDFKGVRSFAGQIKHLATDNFAIWSPITGDPMPAGIEDVNGPENIQTKAQVIQFLKHSFALGHKAIATVTQKNAMDMIPFRGDKLPRLDLAFYALTHANEHYGQMVVYLRLCGIVPPASRPGKK
jgi:uncharacterized damage-inducible protein DinB